MFTAGALRRSGRTEHTVDERTQAIDFADDDLRVFRVRLILEHALEQLRSAADPAERILHFVREDRA